MGIEMFLFRYKIVLDNVTHVLFPLISSHFVIFTVNLIAGDDILLLDLLKVIWLYRFLWLGCGCFFVTIFYLLDSYFELKPRFIE